MASINTNTDPIHNVGGAIMFVGYVIAALFLSMLVVHDIYKAHTSTTLSSSNRGKNVSSQSQLFIALALLSFSILSYHMLSYLIYSYQGWVTSKGVDVLPGLHDPYVFTRSTLHFTQQIWQWLTESTLFQNFAETICNDSATFWWTQQALLVTMVSALFISIEGKQSGLKHLPLPSANSDSIGTRRQVPHLWAYLAIGQILPISFAQNLFFAAILVFPISDDGSATQVPSPLTQCLPVAAYYLLLSKAPSSIGKPSFISVIVLLRLLLLSPFILRSPTFQASGFTTMSLQNAQSGYSTSYVLALFCSGVLFVQQTIWALRENKFSEILAAVNTDSAVSALGYDFIIYVVSCLAWLSLEREETKRNVA
ncbi:MAG: hypothetical protein Q9223_002558 [Gallowayella weberi]